MKRLLIVLPIVVLAAPVRPASPAASALIDAINQEAGGSWHAADNPVTRRTPEARRALLGLPAHQAPATAGGATTETEAEVAAYPAAFDWRANGGNFVTPVRDQGGCGSCWAFATAAALESKALIAEGAPGADLDLSEELLVACQGAVGPVSNSCAGGSLADAAAFVQAKGLPRESCYPYTGTNGVCANACAKWADDTWRIRSHAEYLDHAVSTRQGFIKSLLATGPVAVGYNVYDDFYSYDSGVYRKTASARLEGGHAVLVVGWDDAAGCFIVKNSWGASWGEQGYFRIGYEQMTNGVDFGWWIVGTGASYHFMAAPRADLVCSQFLPPASRFVVGAPVAVQALVANAGLLAAPGSVAALYLSRDGDGNVSDDWYVGALPMAALDPGSSAWARWDFAAPDLGPAPVAVRPLVVVDAGRAVPESSEANLFLSAAFTVTPPRYLQIANPNGGNTWYRGESYTLRWRSRDCATVALWMRRWTGTSWKSMRIAGPRANTGTFTWRVPWTVVAGARWRARVSCTSDPTVFDTSDASFTIR